MTLQTVFRIFDAHKIRYFDTLDEVKAAYSRTELEAEVVHMSLCVDAVVVAELNKDDLLVAMFGTPKPQAYRALDKNGHSIITVLADSAEHATDMIRDQLTQNASRIAYYSKWMAAGCPVSLRD